MGERDLIADGGGRGDAMLHLNVVEFHQIFSPPARGLQGRRLHGGVVGDVELRGGTNYGRAAKPRFQWDIYLTIQSPPRVLLGIQPILGEVEFYVYLKNGLFLGGKTCCAFDCTHLM